MSPDYPSIHSDQPRSRGLAIRLVVWIVSITAGTALFFQMQIFVALFNGEGPLLLFVVSVIGAVVGVVTGTGVGLVQCFAPPHPALKTGAWLFGTMGAWALAGALFELLQWLTLPSILAQLMNEVMSDFITGVGVGLGFGFGQWLAARRYIAKLHLLLLANVVGWSLGLTIASVVFPLHWGPADGSTLAIILAGGIPSLITGITLSKLPTRSARDIATIGSL